MKHESILELASRIGKDLQHHTLKVVCETEKVSVYRCSTPSNGRIMSFQVAFTPEGIAIQGDLTPTEYGTVSTIGYGRVWFAGRLSHDYLAQKFLHKGFHAHLAIEWLRDFAQTLEYDLQSDPDGATGVPASERCNDEEVRIRDQVTALRSLADDEGFNGPDEFREAVDTILSGHDWDDSPWGYNPQEVACLSAIQQCFARCWEAHVNISQVAS